MRLAFDSEQETLRGEFRKVLAPLGLRSHLEWLRARHSHDQILWCKLAELGWLATAIAEEQGGSGLGEAMLCIQSEEIGRSLAPVPFTASIAGYAVGLSHAADAETCGLLLPAIARGDAVGVLLPDDCWRSPPRLVGKGALLEGVTGNVPDASAATAALALVGGGDDASIIQIDLSAEMKSDADAEQLDPLHPAAELTFAGSAVRILCRGTGAIQKWRAIIDRHALFVAFEQLGGAAAALGMAREHVLNRFAFGRPVASFQGVKHALADQFVALDLARSNCYYGAAALASAPERLHEAAAVARISATEAFRRCARGNMQAHGALGVTWESGCHLYYRRAQALAMHPGSLRQWKESLVNELISRRAPGQ